MIALSEDGTTVRCASYGAVETGVALCADEDRGADGEKRGKRGVRAALVPGDDAEGPNP
ncbi:hypothetical protein [Halegenticoccus soli]|uniref:hypothetical protein n=1 Tax=Halegenticoccus soli TaxID=1985678 RepID=UPI001304101A|nr:hypothetical protein [Halegenticoccus soli]